MHHENTPAQPSIMVRLHFQHARIVTNLQQVTLIPKLDTANYRCYLQKLYNIKYKLSTPV